MPLFSRNQLAFSRVSLSNEERNARKDCQKRLLITSDFPSFEESGLISKCVSDFREQRRSYWEGVRVTLEQNLQKNQQKLDKALAKIKRDMRKADCPYE